MAREFGPQGLHVAHVIIDGGIDGERLNSRFPELRAQKGLDGLLNVDAIAEAFGYCTGSIAQPGATKWISGRSPSRSENLPILFRGEHKRRRGPDQSAD